MRTLIALAIGRAVRKIIRLFRHGGGSAVPGTIASKIQPKLFEKAIARFPQGLVVVSGSSGKSSTTKFLVQILTDQGLRVFTNPSTANISQGLFSAVLQGAKGLSLPSADIAVIEMDEAYAAKIGAPLRPRMAVITNVMDEQLDRFHDSGVVVDALRVLANASTQTVLNGNDPSVASLGNRESIYFGLSTELASSEAAPRYSISREHSVEDLDVAAINVDPLKISIRGSEIELNMPDMGLHMALNFLGAAAAASGLVTNLATDKLKQTAKSLQGVYGRDTLEEIHGVESRILLVQNHESFRLNLLRLDAAEQIFMAIGTDVRDPSWLWGVDVSKINRVDVLSGHHAIPMKYRLQSCKVAIGETVEDFEEALKRFLGLEPPNAGERIFVVTADTFRRMKRSLELSS